AFGIRRTDHGAQMRDDEWVIRSAVFLQGLESDVVEGLDDVVVLPVHPRKGNSSEIRAHVDRHGPRPPPSFQRIGTRSHIDLMSPLRQRLGDLLPPNYPHLHRRESATRGV